MSNNVRSYKNLAIITVAGADRGSRKKLELGGLLKTKITRLEIIKLSFSRDSRKL